MYIKNFSKQTLKFLRAKHKEITDKKDVETCLIIASNKGELVVQGNISGDNIVNFICEISKKEPAILIDILNKSNVMDVLEEQVSQLYIMEGNSETN